MSYQPKNPNGQATMANSDPVVIASNQSAIPVTGTFWQATQPVSGTVEIGATSLAALETINAVQSGTWNITNVSGTISLPTGAGTSANQATMITSLQLIDDSVTTDNTAIGTTKLIAVGGTDGTNAQMLSVTSAGAVNIADGGNSITVDGTFWQATQPVSIATMPSTPVTGTFWQATQPVSIATMPSTPVTGTFWQATQPVSGTVSANATLAAETTKVIGTVNIAASQTLATVTTVGAVTAITNALPAGTNAIGKLAANSGVIIGAVEMAPATTNVPTNATTTAYATSLIVKASAGTLYTITGYNSKTTAQFIQVHDSATLPADAAVPKVIFLVPPTSNFSFDVGPYGRSFAAGITICNSSTGPTKTIGAADCWFDAQYK